MPIIVSRFRPPGGPESFSTACSSYHGFITDRDGATLALEADHRRHAEIENAIRDPPTTLLLYGRTAHQFGPPPHFASSPALALGSPVQWRPGTIAIPAISGPDGAAGA